MSQIYMNKQMMMIDNMCGECLTIMTTMQQCGHLSIVTVLQHCSVQTADVEMQNGSDLIDAL